MMGRTFDFAKDISTLSRTFLSSDSQYIPYTSGRYDEHCGRHHTQIIRLPIHPITAPATARPPANFKIPFSSPAIPRPRPEGWNAGQGTFQEMNGGGPSSTPPERSEFRAAPAERDAGQGASREQGRARWPAVFFRPCPSGYWFISFFARAKNTC